MREFSIDFPGSLKFRKQAPAAQRDRRTQYEDHNGGDEIGIISEVDKQEIPDIALKAHRLRCRSAGRLAEFGTALLDLRCSAAGHDGGQSSNPDRRHAAPPQKTPAMIATIPERPKFQPSWLSIPPTAACSSIIASNSGETEWAKA